MTTKPRHDAAPRRTLCRAALALAALLLASACTSTSDPVATPTAQQDIETTTSETTEAPSPTPEPEPVTPMERPLSIRCNSIATPDLVHIFRTIEEAWKSSPENRETCEVTVAEDLPRHDLETEALNAANGSSTDYLELLYQYCTETMLGDVEGTRSYNEGQRAVMEGALILCPDHPDAEEIRTRMDGETEEEAQRAEEEALREEGKIFGSGTYRIGEDIQPGTYASEADEDPFDGCYWELLDDAGNIIDNNFISSAFRVEITVPDSAYSLSVDRCGVFHPTD